jgi:hypothetical protein
VIEAELDYIPCRWNVTLSLRNGSAVIVSDNEFQFSIFAVSLPPIAAGLYVPRKPWLETRGRRIGCRNH